MKKIVDTRIIINQKAITKIQEKLINTGSLKLTTPPRTNQLSKDIYNVLLSHNLVDNESVAVEFLITIKE